jgi:selenocysteine lyase/cysteine desulfurase
VSSLIPKHHFIGLEAVAHLAAGGETPALRAHVDGAARFICDKSGGMPGRARMYDKAAEVKQRVARFLSRRADEIGFLFSASEGLYVAARGTAWRPGDNVVTALTEFPSVHHVWRHGLGIEVRAIGETLVPTLDEIRAAVDARTRIIAVSHVSYLTGARWDLAALREIADRAGARLVVDASHSLGVVPVDGALCDVIVSCCYKWVLGSHGVGIFFVNADRWTDLASPWMGWHSIETEAGPVSDGYRLKASMERFESGNYSFVSLYLLDAGLQALEQAGIPAVEEHVLALGGRLREELVGLGAEVLTPSQPARRAGNLAIPLAEAEQAEAELRAAGVLTWWGSGRLRLSVHAYNDEADVARAAAAVKTILK